MRFRPRLSLRATMILVAVMAFLLGLGMMAFSAREAAALSQCSFQLKEIGLAVQNYYEYSSGCFPPATVPQPGIAPEKRLSWCVLIATFLDQWTWMFDWNEPWDSPANRVTRGHGIEEPPTPRAHYHSLECPRSSLPNESHMPGWTSYVGISGLGPDSPRLPKEHPRAGMFGYDRILTRADVTDGLSYTMMIVETNENLGPWTAGGPSTLRAVNPQTRPYLGSGRPFGGLHPGGTPVLMANGSVRLVPDSTDPEVFEAMATICGGERPILPETAP